MALDEFNDSKMKEWEKKHEQDTYSEMCRIFPQNLLKKTLSIDHIFTNFFTGEEILLNKNKEDLPLWALVDSTLYQGGAERIVLKNYAIKTNEIFDYDPFKISKYSLTDFGVNAMTNFLGNIPEESERLYSIIRYHSEKSDTPLGFSASDMRDFIRWTIDPSKRFLIL